MALLSAAGALFARSPVRGYDFILLSVRRAAALASEPLTHASLAVAISPTEGQGGRAPAPREASAQASAGGGAPSTV